MPGAEPQIDERDVDFCRRIEAYLCQKNDGHLIRVVGPSFELVSRWASEGIPLKIACEGIDRYFERYYRSGPRRRPVRIDFCDADVRDVFDEWRRATGVRTSATADGEAAAPARRGPSIRDHLTRALARLTQARVNGTVGPALDAIVDVLSSELDVARAASGGLRGDARDRLRERLAALDREMLRVARESLSSSALDDLRREAAEELSGFRVRMAPEAFAQATEQAVVRLIRERLGLPILLFS
jgi:hypothetical protein